MESILGTNCSWKQRCWAHEATQTLHWVTGWDTNGPNVISSHLEFNRTGSRRKKENKMELFFFFWNIGSYLFIFHMIKYQLMLWRWQQAHCLQIMFVTAFIKKKKKNKNPPVGEMKKRRGEIECLPLVTHTYTHIHAHRRFVLSGLH